MTTTLKEKMFISFTWERVATWLLITMLAMGGWVYRHDINDIRDNYKNQEIIVVDNAKDIALLDKRVAKLEIIDGKADQIILLLEELRKNSNKDRESYIRQFNGKQDKYIGLYGSNGSPFRK